MSDTLNNLLEKQINVQNCIFYTLITFEFYLFIFTGFFLLIILQKMKNLKIKADKKDKEEENTLSQVTKLMIQ